MFSLGQVDLLLMLLLGATSSLHCTTMCGPIIAVASAPVALGNGKDVRRPKALALWQLQYHLGRGVTYGLIGAVLGLIGTSLVLVPRARLTGAVVQLGLGLLIVVAGVWQLVKGGSRVAATDNWLSRALRALITRGSARGMLGLGLLTGLLPCGVLYVAFSRAVLAGSLPGGALVMVAFWLGTVPLLATVGFASGGLARLVGRYGPVLLCVAMVGTGGWVAQKGVRNLLRQSGIPSREVNHPDHKLPGHGPAAEAPPTRQPTPGIDDGSFSRHPR
jgi:uncharacterized protein